MSTNTEQCVVAKHVLLLVDQARLLGFRAGVLLGSGAIIESNIAWHESNELREELESQLASLLGDEAEPLGTATLRRLQEVADANK